MGGEGHACGGSATSPSSHPSSRWSLHPHLIFLTWDFNVFFSYKCVRHFIGLSKWSLRSIYFHSTISKPCNVWFGARFQIIHRYFCLLSAQKITIWWIWKEKRNGKELPKYTHYYEQWRANQPVSYALWKSNMYRLLLGFKVTFCTFWSGQLFC